MNDLKENLHIVRRRIARAASQAGREQGDVRLLAVGKRHPASRIRDLHGAGQRAFGENYVSEALDKMDALSDLDIEWHYIGPLQSNKTRAIASRFDWVQSVDRTKILRRLSDQRPADLPELNICLQVNIDREPQKSGILPEQLPELAELARSLPGIRLRGLMTIPRAASTDHDPAGSYREMEQMFRSLPGLDTLSMGMSGDLETAVRHGSTMVRIGTDLFGQRPD